MSGQDGMGVREGILFLDDEQNVLNALRRVFQDEDRPLHFTTSPEEALERAAGGGLAVVVSDYRMPTMTGLQFLEKVKQASPDISRILLTGHGDVKMAMEAINREAVHRFLAKPWDDDELIHAVRQAAAHRALLVENRRLQELTLAQNLELKELNGNLEAKVLERTRRIEVLNEDLRKSLLGSVRVLAGLTEVHSKVIGSHSRRVAALSKGMGERMGLDPEGIQQVEIAALLHDVGKMLIPPELLQRNESFHSPREKALVKRHPVLGETLVRMVPNMEGAARLVRHHHERFDGGGTPEGLREEAIPLGSRIIAVADAYDNALNIRAGYQAATPERALRQIRDLAGRDFDPRAVDALEAVLKASGGAAVGADEVEAGPSDLREGMTVSRDVRGARGELLIPARTSLTASMLQFLQERPEAGRGAEGIFIFRQPAEGG